MHGWRLHDRGVTRLKPLLGLGLYHVRMRQHLRRWGAFWIVVTIWLTTWVAYGAMEVMLQGAESHDPWVRFATGTLENVQSEAWFGIVDTLIIVGLAHKLFQRAEDDQKALQAEVTALRQVVESRQQV